MPFPIGKWELGWVMVEQRKYFKGRAGLSALNCNGIISLIALRNVFYAI